MRSCFFYYKDSMKKKGMMEMEPNNKISVLYLETGQRAEIVVIEDTLEAMQNLVKGPIEEYMPFEDDVAIVCNEEGKMRRLPWNRGIKDEDGQLMDIIAGDFFICYAPIESEKFLSLPSDLEKKYKEKFELPEQVFQTENGLKTIPYEPKPRDKELGCER